MLTAGAGCRKMYISYILRASGDRHNGHRRASLHDRAHSDRGERSAHAHIRAYPRAARGEKGPRRGAQKRIIVAFAS